MAQARADAQLWRPTTPRRFCGLPPPSGEVKLPEDFTATNKARLDEFLRAVYMLVRAARQVARRGLPSPDPARRPHPASRAHRRSPRLRRCRSCTRR